MPRDVGRSVRSSELTSDTELPVMPSAGWGPSCCWEAPLGRLQRSATGSRRPAQKATFSEWTASLILQAKRRLMMQYQCLLCANWSDSVCCIGERHGLPTASMY